MGRDAGAGIRDGEHHVRPGFGAWPSHQVRFVEEEIARFNVEPAAIGHRIAGVDGQVQQHLIELGRITDDRPEVLGEVRADLNRSWEGVLHDLLEFGNQVPDLYGTSLAFDATGKSEDLLDHPRTSLDAALDGFEPFHGLISQRFRLEQLSGHEDGRQHVVEVVRNAARQRTEALHPLATEQLRFEVLLLRDVRVDDQNGPRFVLLVPHQRPATGDNYRLAVFRHLVHLAAPFALLKERLPGAY